MLIELSPDSQMPLYQQLKDKIIYAIATGELKENESLPSVRQLASGLSINLHTVNKAYTQLANEGFLTIFQSRGVVVNTKDKFLAKEDDTERIYDKIKIICAQAKCRSLKQNEVTDMCEKAYAQFEGGKNDQ